MLLRSFFQVLIELNIKYIDLLLVWVMSELEFANLLKQMTLFLNSKSVNYKNILKVF